MQSADSFSDESRQPAVRGFLHSPASPNGKAIVLTHGAGADCNAPLLVAISEAFAAHGYLVLPFGRSVAARPIPASRHAIAQACAMRFRS